MGEQDAGGPAEAAPLLVVDAANVVGSVPDGWWRDRRGAAERLRDALVPLAGAGLGDDRAGLPPWARTGPLEVVLVVEGAARGVPGLPRVRVVEAPGSGDDQVVAVVEQAVSGVSPRRCLVVTADRGLRDRVTALGAEVTGPRTVRPT
ncbi:NTP pyrophosphohydrolase [Kitasatospora sp. NPDC093679]|uniref:NTP pyrophosphohydrolase n=1 Tax=Kitasatospora sp. NPDC093679 TaxID=3154983 RepID=UPI003437F441